MSRSLAFMLTTVITAVLFHLLDWLCWGTKIARERVFPKVPPELFRLPTDPAQKVAAGKRAGILGAIVTTFTAVFFVPMVWLLGPRFAGARVLLLAIILWLALLLPGALYNGIYFRLPVAFVKLQAIAVLARVLTGLVAVTWLLTMFGVW